MAGVTILNSAADTEHIHLCRKFYGIALVPRDLEREREREMKRTQIPKILIGTPGPSLCDWGQVS